MVEVTDALFMQSIYAAHKASQNRAHRTGKATEGTGSGI